MCTLELLACRDAIEEDPRDEAIYKKMAAAMESGTIQSVHCSLQESRPATAAGNGSAKVQCLQPAGGPGTASTYVGPEPSNVRGERESESERQGPAAAEPNGSGGGRPRP